ncbi:hypothetical protein GCM10010495_76640 [Kitasatospora herbaricolor]|nr:hypothetical protein GCM10010495_76640 [Kitasatospora herbaricolor]
MRAQTWADSISCTVAVRMELVNRIAAPWWQGRAAVGQGLGLWRIEVGGPRPKKYDRTSGADCGSRGRAS